MSTVCWALCPDISRDGKQKKNSFLLNISKLKSTKFLVSVGELFDSVKALRTKVRKNALVLIFCERVFFYHY